MTRAIHYVLIQVMGTMEGILDWFILDQKNDLTFTIGLFIRDAAAEIPDPACAEWSFETPCDAAQVKILHIQRRTENYISVTLAPKNRSDIAKLRLAAQDRVWQGPDRIAIRTPLDVSVFARSDAGRSIFTLDSYALRTSDR